MFLVYVSEMVTNCAGVYLHVWLCVVGGVIASFCHGEFLGGTISWMVIPGNKVKFQYRISWTFGTGPCGQKYNKLTLGTECSKFTPEIAKLSWMVHDGNFSQTLGDLRYIATSYSNNGTLSWEQGEYTFFYKAMGTPFTVSLSSTPWLLSGNDTVTTSGHMVTLVNTGMRNDTRKPNASPYCALPPFIGIPLDCSSTTPLPVEDPEGEAVRCRWATPAECGTGCTNLPDTTVHLDETGCLLIVHAYQSAGYKPGSLYRVAVMLEDLAPASVTLGSTVLTKKQPLSRIPLQFTIRISSQPSPCNGTGLQFVLPTPTHRARPSYGIMDYLGHKSVELSFYLEAHNISTSQFQLSGPMFLQYDYLSDDLSTVLNRTNVTRMYLQWQPKIASPWQQISYQQICVWGLSENGISTFPHCITDIVTDSGDFCMSTVKCQNNGTCLNLYKDPNEKCICPVGYKGDNCSVVVSCFDKPCENNGTCTPLSGGTYRCTCPKDFTGPNCDHEVDCCVSSPCLNGGTCINGHQLTYTCLCTTTFTGADCQTERSTSKTSGSLLDSIDWQWLLILVGMVCSLLLTSTAICCAVGKKLKQERDDTTGTETAAGKWAVPRR